MADKTKLNLIPVGTATAAAEAAAAVIGFSRKRQ